MIETQDALDDEHLGTTRAYVQTIAVKLYADHRRKERQIQR